MKYLNFLSGYRDRHYHHHQYIHKGFAIAIITTLSLASVNLSPLSAQSLKPVSNSTYKPTPITTGIDINDTLTDKDIPTGQKGFARDYSITLQKDERLEITVRADRFDTVLSLLDSKGEVVAENDDAVGEGSNSLVFFRVVQSGNYTIRVSSFGGSSGGKFVLRVNRLRVVN